MQIRLDFLNERLDEIAFIEMKKALSLSSGYSLSKDIPLPVKAQIIKDKIFDVDPSFLQNELIDGILFLLGLDPKFKHAEAYKRLLLSIDERILEIKANELLQSIDDSNGEETLIKLVGIVHLGLASDLMLIQIGRLAQELFAQKEKEDFETLAYRIFTYLEKHETSEPLAYFHLGYHAYNHGRYSQAQEFWEKSIELGLSEEDRRALIEIHPQLKLRLVYEEGVDLIFKGRYTEGLEKLLSIRDAFSEWWNLMFFIGLGHRYQEDYKEAIYYFNRARELNPQQVDILNELGISHTMIGEEDQAILVFSQALAMEPENHEILCNMGIAHFHAGDEELAKKLIQRAHDLAPEDEVTNQWVRHLNMHVRPVKAD